MFLFIQSILSHSWLDCIGSANHTYNGNVQYFSDADFKGTCIGYPRAYPGRMDPNINTEFTYPILDRQDVPVCSSSQMSAHYSLDFPLTKTTGGAMLKLWWEMDNHLSPQTTIDLYWSHSQTQLQTYNELIEENKLISLPFATNENCMDTSQPNTLCWGEFKVPYLSAGVYPLVWVWNWNQNPKGELYTTCFDLEIV